VGTRIGFVSTYPPTQCGLATFTASLRDALVGRDGSEECVVRLVDRPQPSLAPQVVADLIRRDRASLAHAVAHLNGCDIAIIQHEYGIYGGRDGDEILTLLDGLDVPRLVVLHTVIREPSRYQRQILEAVVAKADAVITMTGAARDRLNAVYDVPMGKVCVIPHGASAPPQRGVPIRRPDRPTILTWGLLGPGKGVEWGIEAMSLLRDLKPMPRYIVAGQTHPNVVSRDGEAYRMGLRARVHQLGLQPAVTFDGKYRDAPGLADLVQAADIVLLPYDSADQVTSGVLVEAVAAGKPVVATGFPHAVELLADGAGVVVAHRSPVQIAAALRSLITHPAAAAEMARIAGVTGARLHWPAVAEEYHTLATELIAATIAA
jgi:glycosyltransferase involved in cell wall biosynthesis